MDPFSPFVPAYIRVLVLPVGEIDRATFLAVLRRLQDDAGTITLTDIVPFLDDHDEFLHAPTTTSKGSLLYDYTSFPPQDHEQQLSPFELFREPLLVIGLVNGAAKQDGYRTQELEDAADYLKERHPRVVDRELIVLGEAPEGAAEDEPATENVVFVERHSDINDASLKDAVHKISARFLKHLSTYTMALQMSPSIQTPGQTARSLQRTTSQRDSERRPGSSSGRSTPSQSNDAMSPVDDSGTRQLPWNRGSPATSFDQIQSASNISRSDSRASNRGKQGARASSQDRVSVQGFGASTSQDKLKQRGKARVGLVVGSIHMMAGNWSEALRILTENTNKARILADHIWHGKGLDNIVCCLLLHSWAGLEYQIPSVCYLVADRAAQRFSVTLPSDSRPESAQQASVRSLSTALPDLLKLVSSLYRGGEGALELPLVPIAEATVRFSKTLAVIYLSNGGLDRSVLDRFVGRKKAKDYQDLTKPSDAPMKPFNGVSKMNVADMLVQVAESDLTGIPETAHVAILAGVAGVYALVGMERKKGMALKDLMARLTVPLQQAHIGIRDVDERGRLPSTATELTRLGLSNDSIDGLMDELSRIYGFQLLPESGPEVKHIPHHSTSFGFHNLKVKVLDQLWRMTEPTATYNSSRALRVASSALAATGPNGAVAKDLVGLPEIVDDTVLDHSETYAGYIMGGLVPPDAAEEAMYWDYFIVRGFQFVRPQEQLLIQDRKDMGVQGSAAGNPLLYDPSADRSGTAATPRTLVFAMGEKIECLITFQNVLKIPVAISSLQLATEGAEVEWLGLPFSIDSNKFTTIRAEFVPRSLGPFAITGCRIKVVGCEEGVFPIVPDVWLPRPSQLVKEIGQDFARAVAEDRAEPNDDNGQNAIFRAIIVPPMPRMEWDEAILPAPNLMLIAGENWPDGLVVRMRNCTNVPAAVLEMSREIKRKGNILVDTRRSLAKLATGEDMADNDSGDLIIPPNGTMYLNATSKYYHADAVTCRISYTGAVDPGNEVRHLCLAFDVEAAPGLQIRHLDVQALDGVKDDSTSDVNECILCLGLANKWVGTMHYECELLDQAQTADQADTRHTRQGTLITGASSRLQFRIRRIIPYNGASITTEDALAIIKSRLKISWHTENRAGEVETTHLTFPSEALINFLAPPLSLNLTLLPTSPEPAEEATHTLRAGSLATIRLTITNHSLPAKTPLLVSLRHSPLPGCNGGNNTALEEKRCAVVGVAKRFVKPLEIGEETGVDFVVCCLLSGEVEVLGEVVPVRVEEGGVEGMREKGVVGRLGLVVVK